MGEVVFDLGGTLVVVEATWLVAFIALVLLCVLEPLWFNRSPDSEGDYVDERWGSGAIDDDWGLPPR